MSTEELNYDVEEVAGLTQRWSRQAQKMFPKWELNELHNEAFLVAIYLLKAGRYKPEKAKLSTFLWHALPMDVRHRYRNANGERYLTDVDGKRKYRKTEFVDDTIISQAQTECPMQILEPKPQQSKVDRHWLEARLAGIGAAELRKRGMNYKEQRRQAELLYDEQQAKRKEGRT
tara:strand:+ start:29 stop:550 length:522 start_codon:yes stop_codon:yes gene_type:complete